MLHWNHNECFCTQFVLWEVATLPTVVSFVKSMLSSDGRLVFNKNLAAELSELELKALDDEDAILDIRA